MNIDTPASTHTHTHTHRMIIQLQIFPDIYNNEHVREMVRDRENMTKTAQTGLTVKSDPTPIDRTLPSLVSCMFFYMYNSTHIFTLSTSIFWNLLLTKKKKEDTFDTLIYSGKLKLLQNVPFFMWTTSPILAMIRIYLSLINWVMLLALRLGCRWCLIQK